MMSKLVLDHAVLFTLSVDDTSEGFLLRMTDSYSTDYVDLFKTTSYSLIMQEFNAAIERLETSWFKVKSISQSTNHSYAVFEPIKQFVSKSI